MKDDHVHSPEETEDFSFSKAPEIKDSGNTEMSRTQDTHSQRDKIETGITLFDKDIAIKPDNSHAQILKELSKEADRVDFRYSSKDSRGTKHGVHISDVKRIIKKAISLTEAATLKKVEKIIDIELLYEEAQNKTANGRGYHHGMHFIKRKLKELGASS